MFTGIIQKKAQVIELKQVNPESYQLKISNPYASQSVTDPVELGESIANNGVCLTVTGFSADHLQFDLAPATVNVTALSRLKTGSQVNLERSMRMGDRLSGHWVQGHVDGRASVTELKELDQGFFQLTIEPPPALLRYCVSKGSLCVDGISLTIQNLTEKTLTFQIIPHTWAETALSDLGIGDLVNIEVDILAKYIERFQEYDQTRAFPPLTKRD